MRRAVLLCAVAIMLSAAGGGLAAEAPADLGAADLEQAKAAAYKYLKYLAADDRAQLKKMQPSEPKHRYGPYPFAGMPSLGQPKVDAHRAGLEFKGKATDASLPPKGAIILARKDKDTKDPWKIRSIIWYEKLPFGVKMPKTSVTREDVAQEALALQAVRSYLKAWREEDWARMKVLTYDWLSRTPEKRTRAGFKSAQLRLTRMPEGEVKVDYTARVVFFRFIPKTVRGRLYCVREGEVWKVRGSAFLL